jgi:hypothetical protein|eukprot:evm.model.NODE_24620_length_7834_cov_43.659306.1
MRASTSSISSKNAQVKAHYDDLLGKTYTWYVRVVRGGDAVSVVASVDTIGWDGFTRAGSDL